MHLPGVTGGVLCHGTGRGSGPKTRRNGHGLCHADGFDSGDSGAFRHFRKPNASRREPFAGPDGYPGFGFGPGDLHAFIHRNFQPHADVFGYGDPVADGHPHTYRDFHSRGLCVFRFPEAG